MRTNIVLDEALVGEALALTGLKTKKAVIEEALRVLTRLKRQEQVRALRGRLHWEGDLDALRIGRVSDVAD
ncbi:MAG: type II toxin-antitoxin system VapB family antitoxin [Anaerolineae bacterium]|nr:type II toxin-antitoxin system VapB family antitoxin [Anaerolineae bacterium]